MLMPAGSALLVVFFSSFPLVQRLITDISGNPRKQRLLLPNRRLCNHITTCHFPEGGRGKKLLFTWGYDIFPTVLISTWESGCRLTVLPDIQWLLYLNDKLNLCAITNKVLQHTIICHLHYTPNLNHLIHKQTVLKWILHKDTAFVFYAAFHTTLYSQQDAQNSKLDLWR